MVHSRVYTWHSPLLVCETTTPKQQGEWKKKTKLPLWERSETWRYLKSGSTTQVEWLQEAPATRLEEVRRDSSVGPCMNLRKDRQGAFPHGEARTLRHKIRIPCFINRTRMAQVVKWNCLNPFCPERRWRKDWSRNQAIFAWSSLFKWQGGDEMLTELHFFFWLGDVKVKRIHTTLCRKENAHYLECRSRGWNLSCWAQERSGIKSEKKSLKMKPKLDAAQERGGIAENKRQRPGKIESARETMTGVEVTEIEYIHDWRLQGRRPISWHKRNI